MCLQYLIVTFLYWRSVLTDFMLMVSVYYTTLMPGVESVQGQTHSPLTGLQRRKSCKERERKERKLKEE
jgi:hypothetical protein